MKIIMTLAPNVVAYRHRLAAHFINDLGLASKIRYENLVDGEPLRERSIRYTRNSAGVIELQPGQALPDNYWISPFKTNVLALGNKTLAYSKVSDVTAIGSFDEDGNKTAPSIVEALNIDPITKTNRPVMEVLAVADTIEELFNSLNVEQVALVREFYPEFVEATDEEGEPMTIQRGLIWEYLV